MKNELLYAIGEVLMMEIYEIENISYPKSHEPDSLVIETKSGKRYHLILKVVEN